MAYKAYEASYSIFRGGGAKCLEDIKIHTWKLKLSVEVFVRVGKCLDGNSVVGSCLC